MAHFFHKLLVYMNSRRTIVRKIILLAILPLLISFYNTSQPSASEMTPLLQQTLIEKRGCCSWHGGVCGCAGGRAKCCDGTLSPSCGC